jgi:hypothetical protein
LWLLRQHVPGGSVRDTLLLHIRKLLTLHQTDWTSSIGYTDNAAHYNIDFLPWFLAEMKKQEAKTKKRLLDYLDIHYYFQADTSSNNATAKALRLRATRSLWASHGLTLFFHFNDRSIGHFVCGRIMGWSLTTEPSMEPYRGQSHSPIQDAYRHKLSGDQTVYQRVEFYQR